MPAVAKSKITKARREAKPKAPPVQENNAYHDGEALLEYLRGSGTGSGRIEAIEQYLSDNAEQTAEDVFLWMRSDPDTFKRGTLEKAGYWVYGNNFTMAVVGEEVGESLAQLRAENAHLKEQLREREGLLAAERTRYRILEERYQAASAEQRINSSRADAQASLNRKGQTIGEEMITASPEQEAMSDILSEE